MLIDLAFRSSSSRRAESAAELRRWAKAMRNVLLFSVYWMAIPLAAAETNGPAISLMEDGTLAIRGSAEVPRYAGDGRWTEMRGKSSARYVTRHFLFVVPNAPPAMELYVTGDRTGDPPDGGFEIGLVSGFLSGFSSKAGFRHDEPLFDDTVAGSSRMKRCRVELSKGERKLWLYAYVFLRQPSLIFLTVRPRSDASTSIEDYLKRVRLR